MINETMHLEVALSRVKRELDAKDTVLDTLHDSLQWVRAILLSDDTDCRKQDKIEECVEESLRSINQVATH